ncbi:MAG: bifunctional 4-hydroxy-3-methylbut-2-enyl diphosphate reductase/30S ribosomal protein S1, partial [Clostridiales bacterium]|nr:bifunctional 4-hydroxy-3-methylbut-2-enyl diphosphate reductase/30S ribosomal protein S1 [Clostridiales bacterium]
MTSFELSREAGFCSGVARALEITYGLLGRPRRSEMPGGAAGLRAARPGAAGAAAEAGGGQAGPVGAGGKRILIWGPLIHNRTVTDELEALGARIAEDFSELGPDTHVILRAHGVAPDVVAYLDERRISYSDATCVNVRRIQRLAQEKALAGYRLILIGDKGHPEVVGINGWAGGKAYVAAEPQDAAAFFSLPEFAEPGAKVCALTQTTFSREKQSDIVRLIRQRCPSCEIHDTICGATQRRRDAAGELSRRSDAMLVVGSRESANTRGLYELCKVACPQTRLIETDGDLPPSDTFIGKKTGIAAGASTPDWIIKEVLRKMEEIRRQDGDISFEDAMEAPIVTLQTGQTVKGKIIRYNNTEVYVDLGYKSDGIIPIEEFATEPDQEPSENIRVGEEIDVFVVRVNDSDGNVLLSKKRVDETNSVALLEEAYENRTPVKATVIEITKGGLLALSGGVRVFIPASQVSDKYVEDLKPYSKKHVDLKIIDYNKQKRKFVGSIKALILEERARAADMLWDSIDVGQVLDGKVRSLTAFGAFVDIGGVDGLIHISALSWDRVRHPSDVLKVGDVITVRVIRIDPEKRKISLSYRKDEDNPWHGVEDRYPVGSIVTRKVVRIAPFGAFIEMDKDVDALVHVSQISDSRISKPDDVLHVGMEVTAKVVDVSSVARKISLSIKAVEPIPYMPAGRYDDGGDGDEYADGGDGGRRGDDGRRGGDDGRRGGDDGRRGGDDGRRGGGGKRGGGGGAAPAPAVREEDMHSAMGDAFRQSGIFDDAEVPKPAEPEVAESATEAVAPEAAPAAETEAEAAGEPAAAEATEAADAAAVEATEATGVAEPAVAEAVEVAGVAEPAVAEAVEAEAAGATEAVAVEATEAAEPVADEAEAAPATETEVAGEPAVADAVEAEATEVAEAVAVEAPAAAETAEPE